MAQMSTSDLPRIGDVIRAWRIFRGLRSTELAARAGVRSQYLSEIEHNRTNNPKEDYLKKLANALEVPLKDILGRGMPPKDGGMVTTPSSKQRLAGQGSQQVSADEDEDDEAVEEDEQENGTPTDSGAHPAISVRSLPSNTTGGKIDRRIASGRFTEEEEKEVEAALIELIDRFISFKETQRKMQRKN